MSERQIFEHALELTDPARREQFLSQACGADHELRQRIDALLTSHDEQSRFLETPVVQQIQTPSDISGEATVQLPPGASAARDDDSDSDQSADLSFLKPSTKPGSIGLLGHYEVLQVLGQGAFGIVFKAFDEKLQRHVAIKTMNVQMAATSPPRKRFLREARAAAAIRHDNVTQVYSVEEEPIPYLVMEYIDGITLHTKLNSVGPLDIPEMLHLGKQIAFGLAAAHEKGLVHRDIKPGNILLEKGAEQKVKITDFGLARAADDASLTQSGLIAGTPLYMAPEQALGQALDARTDLFSFGSVLYQMAAGHPPFRAPTTVAVLRRVVDDTQRPLKEVIPEIPDWFVIIVNKLLSKNPDERYQSAKEVADLLARCQSELQLTGQVTCIPASVRREPDGFATLLTEQPGGSRRPLASGSAAEATPVRPYPRIRSWPVVLSVVLVMGIQLVGLMLQTNRTTTLALSIGAMLLSVLLGVGELFSFRKRQREFRDGSSALPEKKLTASKVLFALLLGVLVMSPILFGRHLSRLTSSWFFGSIPTLPVVERAAGLRFDGEGDFVQVPVSWDHPQFTIEAFVTPEEAGPHRTVVELTNYGSGTKDERLELYDAVGGKGERLSFAAVTGRSGRLNAYGPQTPGIREHRAIVCDGQEIHYYINGVWQGKRNNQPQDNQLWRMRWLTIGCQLGRNNFFKGEIDQLRISKVARYTDNFPAASLVESDDATLALYNFEEGTGDVLKDMSGNGHDAKISGATWIHPAQGLQFDGVDDYVEIPGLSWNSNQYTIEAYISQDGGHGNLFQTAGTGGMLHMYLYPKGGGAGINRDQVYANANGPRKGKTRQHLAVVYDGQNLNYFVQGQLAGVKTNVSAAATPMPLDRMTIGSKLQTDPSKPEFFEGRLEQLRVSNKVRYVLPFQPGELKTDNETLALYDFTTGEGDVIKDSCGKSPDGKIVGATWVERSGIRKNSAKGWHGWPADAPPPAIAPFDSEQAKQHQTAWAKHLGISAEFTDKHGMKFVLIPPGEFQMGYSQTELDTLTRELKQAGAGEFDLFAAGTSGPQHQVRITQPFYISAHEVTVAQYRTFLDETKYLPTADQLGAKIKWADFIPKENPDPHPAVGVSWTDADSFCVLRSQKDGVTYRLPSEAEWEYACRAGSTTLWSYGENPAELGEYAVTSSAGVTQIQPVGSRKPNALGLFDMYGNAEEWCRDWHVQDYYAKSPVDDPVNLASPEDKNSGRVCRGGGVGSLPWQTRSSSRRWDYPSSPVVPRGFRVVLSGDLKNAVETIKAPDDRQIAEWLFTLKGSISMTLLGQPRPVTRVEDLPADAVHIVGVELQELASEFGDADLVRLGQLSHLGIIILNTANSQPLSRLTDAGVALFVQTPASKSLTGFLFYAPMPGLTDATIPMWTQLPALSGLQLLGTQITNPGLQLLRSSTLTELRIFDSPQITPAAFQGAAERLPSLSALRLRAVSLGTADLSQIAQLPLQTLQLSNNGLEDRSITPLLTMGTLRNLSLDSNPKIQDEAIRTLSEIKSLEILTLDNTGITDAACPMLTQFPSLTAIGMNGTAITDAGLDSLAKLTALREVWVKSCPGITAEGVNKLQLAIPNCKVIGDLPVPGIRPFHPMD